MGDDDDIEWPEHPLGHDSFRGDASVTGGTDGPVSRVHGCILHSSTTTFRKSAVNGNQNRSNEVEAPFQQTPTATPFRRKTDGN
jgi:hypothetical protein